MNVTFVRREPVAADTETFWFQPEQPVRYIAGQFTELFLPHQAVDNRGPRRWFTISSSPTEPLIGITTRFARECGSSYKNELGRLRPGENLKLADPMGDFVLPKDPAIPLTFVAISLGITPMRSMVKWLLNTGEQRRITLIYATGRDDQLAFLELLREYPLQLITVVRQPSASYHGEAGTLSAQRIIDLAQPAADGLLYLSGPEITVEKITKNLLAHGLPPESVITDYFPGYPQP